MFIMIDTATYISTSSFDLPLEARLEYLTLAVGNAKSHPVSAGSRQETAIAFLTDLEEKLEVAQVQLEILNFLQKYYHDQDERGERVRLLSKGLMTITEVRTLRLPYRRSMTNRCISSYIKNTPCHSTC